MGWFWHRAARKGACALEFLPKGAHARGAAAMSHAPGAKLIVTGPLSWGYAKPPEPLGGRGCPGARTWGGFGTALPEGAHVCWLLPMSRAPGAVLIATADPGVRTDSPREDAADPGGAHCFSRFPPSRHAKSEGAH